MQKKKISIVAGDMVGFSRLIEEDEINTLKRQKIIIKDIIDPKLGENNGKLIKTTGDGFLAVFENCDESLSFSIEIQNQIIDQEKIIIPEKKIWYRIGINYGEIILENDDIYGNEVNIASRVESICEPGGISITSSVKENLKTDNIKLKNIGYQVLKNIKKPVEVYQLNLKDKNLDLDLTGLISDDVALAVRAELMRFSDVFDTDDTKEIIYNVLESTRIIGLLLLPLLPELSSKIDIQLGSLYKKEVPWDQQLKWGLLISNSSLPKPSPVINKLEYE